jgi:CDP-paratose 2-epimerase
MSPFSPNLLRGRQPFAVIGGAGFIGCNLADRLLGDGEEVVVIDNLSRPGVESNLGWLQARHGSRVQCVIADVTDEATLRAALRDVRAVFHFAAQVAVTTSVEHPMDDFVVNAQGTLTVLEALRALGKRVPVIYSSTNKVYGALLDLEMDELDDRYAPSDPRLLAHGVDEARGLAFCTPYGCSKGVADQYVLDYAKSFDMPTAVLRMSCIYGPRQFGTEDQGWVAHFLIRALAGEPVTIYGSGKQVRDILHVSDAVEAYVRVLDNIAKLKGQAFNLGGGPRNAVSLQMVLREIERLTGHPISIECGDWRIGDQLYFVADTRKLQRATEWSARTDWRDGLASLVQWLKDQSTPAEQEHLRRVTA